ncbi:MAG: hypothetical protein ACLTD4_00610 [Hungatella sp.]
MRPVTSDDRRPKPFFASGKPGISVKTGDKSEEEAVVKVPV